MKFTLILFIGAFVTGGVAVRDESETDKGDNAISLTDPAGEEYDKIFGRAQKKADDLVAEFTAKAKEAVGRHVHVFEAKADRAKRVRSGVSFMEFLNYYEHLSKLPLPILSEIQCYYRNAALKANNLEKDAFTAWYNADYNADDCCTPGGSNTCDGVATNGERLKNIEDKYKKETVTAPVAGDEDTVTVERSSVFWSELAWDEDSVSYVHWQNFFQKKFKTKHGMENEKFLEVMCDFQNADASENRNNVLTQTEFARWWNGADGLECCMKGNKNLDKGKALDKCEKVKNMINGNRLFDLNAS